MTADSCISRGHDRLRQEADSLSGLLAEPMTPPDGTE
jgi:hypothetical protein